MPDGQMAITLKGNPEHLDDVIQMLQGKPAQEAAGGAPAMPMGAATPPSPAPLLPASSAILGRVPPPSADIIGQPATAMALLPPRPRSLLGKVEHGLGVAGEIAGTAFAPRLMPFIPGTTQHNIMEEQLREKRESEEAINSQRGAQAGLQAAEAGAIPSRQKLEEAQTEAEKQNARMMGEKADLLHNAVGALQSPDAMKQFTESLGKMSPDESAAMQAALQDAKMTGSFAPLTSAVEKIYGERTTSGRVRQGAVFQDADSPTGWSSLKTDANNNPIGVIRGVAAPYAYVPTQATQQHVLQGPGGTYQTVQTTSTRRPIAGGAAAVAGGAAPSGGGGGGATGALVPLNQTEQKNLDGIQQADQVATRLLGVLNSIDKSQSQFGNAVTNRSMNWLYNHGIMTKDDQDAFIQLAGLLKVVGSMPFAVASRNFGWIHQTQQHLSDPNATFAENEQRVKRLVNEIYPDLQRGLLKGKYGDNAPRAAKAYGLSHLFEETAKSGGASTAPQKPWEMYKK